MSFDRRNTLDDDDDDAIDSNIGMTMKAIVLDDGFWQSITEMLHVAMPIIKLLRLPSTATKPVIPLSPSLEHAPSRHRRNRRNRPIDGRPSP